MPASQAPSKLPLITSLAVVLICVVLGGAFVWWYLVSAGQSATVRLSPQDMSAMQSAGQQLAFRQNGGTAAPQYRAGTGGPRVVQLRAAPDPDGVFPVANFIVIRSGQTLVRVQVATATDPLSLTYRQRTWGLIQDAPSFTIARRIVHEDALAHQLAITADQLAALNKIVSMPPLKGTYLTALPVSDSDMTLTTKAWTTFWAAHLAPDKKGLDQARADLLSTTRSIGKAALAKAKQEYAAADSAITQTLSAAQIEAYHSGKTLNP